jgi:hypothetical protein
MRLHPHARLQKTPDGLPAGYETSKHPGHWELHHVALPGNRPGDFTPVRLPDYAEETSSPIRELVEHVLDVITSDPRTAADREAE